MMLIGAPREILVCSRDRFPVGPARRGFAADAASANPSASGLSPNSPIELTG
jgi:hypothetical protein